MSAEPVAASVKGERGFLECQAKQRDKENKARLIPVVLRACNWSSEAYFKAYQALPRAGKPVKEWADKDQAFLNVENGLRRAIAEVQKMLVRS